MSQTKINSGFIGAGAITANSVLSTGVITADLIATGNVGTSEIANLSITDSKITSNAVTNAKIADSAVTAAKIQGNAVGALQLNANAVVGDIASSNGVFTHNSNTFRKAQSGYVTTVANVGGDGYGSANLVLNFANSNNFDVTLANTVNLDLPSNPTVGQSGTIIVRQDSTGSRLLTFNYQWHFAGGTDATLTTTASAVDRLDYYVLAANAIHVVATLDLK